MRLETKVFFWFVVIVAVVGSMYAYTLVSYEGKIVTEQFLQEGESLVQAIQQNLEYQMVSISPGKFDAVQRAINRIQEHGLVRSVFVFSNRGAILAASDTSRIGEETDVTVVQEVLRTGEKTWRLLRQDGEGYVAIIQPIINEPECRACHNPETRLLGAIKVHVSTASLEKTRRQETVLLVVLAALGFVLGGGAVALTFRRLVTNPLSLLAAAAQRISEGDYSVRVGDRGKDEMAQVARAFDEMAHQVEERTRQLDSQVNRLTSDLAKLHAFGQTLASKMELGDLVQGLVETTRDLLRGDACSVYLLDEDKAHLLLVAMKGMGDEAAGSKLRLGESIIGWCAQERKVASVGDISLDSRFGGGSGLEAGFRSLLAVPLVSRGELVGVISIHNRAPRWFSEAEESLMSTIAHEAAIALQNAELYAIVSAQSITDGLTGLYNHRYFQERMEDEIRRASRSNIPVSLLFCDIDLFKTFNDLNGHSLGDGALQDVARIIKGSLRAVDIAARYGGEEFVVILPETDDLGAQVVAERIRKEIASHPFESRDGGSHPLTVSIGVAAFPQDASSRLELIDKADWAMYYAKRKGRNRVCLFDVEKNHFKELAAEEIIREELFLSTAHALAAAVDAKDSYTGSHSESVARYASEIGHCLGLTDDAIQEVRVAGLLHDVGKIGIPDEVLLKKTPLSEDEWKIIREHPAGGASIISHVASLRNLIGDVLHHHERYDGTGYPGGLRGEEIPLGARILCVADAYHAMLSDRPYRGLLTQQQALAELRANAGKQFDPQVVEALIRTLALEDETNEESRPRG